MTLGIDPSTIEILRADQVALLVQKGISAQVKSQMSARFQPGDRVRARQINPVTFTRLPRYVRGKQGVVERDYGVFVFPDTVAHRAGDHPQHLYSVRFTAQELWGAAAFNRDVLYIDLYEEYLDPV